MKLLKPCKCCGADYMGDIIGVQYGVTNIIGVAFNCVCGTTRCLPWEDATEHERNQSVLAEKARLALEGLI